MKKVNQKHKLIANAIGITFGVVFALYLIGCTSEIWWHNAHNNHTISKANLWVLITRETADMKVVDCVATEDYYEVVVEDIKGNQWAYYDDVQKEIGTVLSVTFDGNEIIDVSSH